MKVWTERRGKDIEDEKHTIVPLLTGLVTQWIKTRLRNARAKSNMGKMVFWGILFEL